MGRVPYLRAATGELTADGGDIPNFLPDAEGGKGRGASLQMYDTAAAEEIYRNFLDWMFATFRVEEADFRRDMARRLAAPKGGVVLVTGCGLGDDIPALLEAVGPDGEVYAQDLSPTMVHGARARLLRTAPEAAARVSFSVGDASSLPFEGAAFDAAYHFGGINLFDDPAAGIAEMNRVVRPGGRVLVSDEGVGPWLSETDYGRMVVTNNRLWAHRAPIDRVPPTARDVTLSWVLEGCFWVIDFTVSDSLPRIDPHVIHKGRRGGSMWTRHHGQLEAVTPETKVAVEAAAAAAGLSVHDWMERALKAELDS